MFPLTSSPIAYSPPWGGMTNAGMKEGVSSQEDAVQYLKYLDGTTYTGIPGLIPDFQDKAVSPFRIIEQDDGSFKLANEAGSDKYHVLCQLACPCKSISELTLSDSPHQCFHC